MEGLLAVASVNWLEVFAGYALRSAIVILLIALLAFALYHVIRRAVRDGILDARKQPQCPIDLALKEETDLMEDMNWP